MTHLSITQISSGGSGGNGGIWYINMRFDGYHNLINFKNKIDNIM